MANADLKDFAKRKGVYLWEIASYFNKTDTAFSKHLRFELSQEDELAIREAINAIAKEHEER